jgi:hypothetical protein
MEETGDLAAGGAQEYQSNEGNERACERSSPLALSCLAGLSLFYSLVPSASLTLHPHQHQHQHAPPRSPPPQSPPRLTTSIRVHDIRSLRRRVQVLRCHRSIITYT